MKKKKNHFFLLRMSVIYLDLIVTFKQHRVSNFLWWKNSIIGVLLKLFKRYDLI